MSEYKREAREPTVLFLHYAMLSGRDRITHGAQTQNKIVDDGFTKILIPRHPKQSTRSIQLMENMYQLSCIYVLPRSIHSSLIEEEAIGELILEHKPTTRGQPRILVCIPLLSGGSQVNDDLKELIYGESCQIERVIDSYFSDSVAGIQNALVYHNDTIVVMKKGISTDVPLSEYDLSKEVKNGVYGINKERNDTRELFNDTFDFPFSNKDKQDEITVQYFGSSPESNTYGTSHATYGTSHATYGTSHATYGTSPGVPTSTLESWLTWFSGGQEGFREGLNMETGLNADSINRGFGSFDKSIGQSAKTFNQAGEDYIFDFSKSKSSSEAPMVASVGEYVDCVPIYDNADQISTFVIPYGSTLSDDATKMFMTSTFQMFYTLLVAFVILFLTPILYKGYFAVAMRRGTTDDPEYGNKLTYSANLYFVLFTLMMIIGVLIDAAIYTQSTTELGFAIMLMVFFVCTYMFTLMLRSSGFDRTVYGDLSTKYKMSEIFGLYAQFMQQYSSITYSFLLPAAAVGLSVGISVLAYQNKTGKTGLPFGNMIALFFIGMFLVFSTMGAFINKWIKIRQADATQM